MKKKTSCAISRRLVGIKLAIVISLTLLACCFADVAMAGLFAPYVYFTVGSWPEAVAIGDVNGDGRNDVVMTTSYYFDAANDYKLFVFLQNSSGTLDPPIKYSTHGTYTNSPVTVAIGDVNHDGRNDVVVGNKGSGLDVFIQNPQGGLDAPITYAGIDSYKIRIADLNHDGLLDVVGVGWGNNTASIWLQNTQGTLNPPVTYSVEHGGYDDLEVGDVNNDGLTDIIVMSGQLYAYNNVGVLLQQQNGTFGQPVYYDLGGNIITNGVAVGDINSDKRNDMVVTFTFGGGIGAFLQNTSGSFDPAMTYSSNAGPQAIEIMDVNNDGKNDVIVLGSSLGVFVQDDNGHLSAESLYAVPVSSYYNSQRLAVGDINGDGRNDVAIADFTGNLVILYNDPTIEVATSQITAITLTSATGGGEVTSQGGSAVNQKGVCWNTTGNPSIGDNCTMDGSGTGTFTSSIAGLTPSTSYHVRAYATNSNGTVYGNEVTFTTLAIPSVTVTSPNGGENWIRGTINTIKWSYTGNPGDSLAIQLYKGNTLTDTITSNTPTCTGSYNWTIPISLATGTKYRIKIVSTTNGNLSDISDSYFTIIKK